MTAKISNPPVTNWFRGVGAGALLASALVACGGGTASHDGKDGALTIAAAVGNYATDCEKAGSGTTYKKVSGSFSDAGNGTGIAVVHYGEYGTDGTCSEASRLVDVTGTFDVLPLAETKEILASPTAGHPIAGTAYTAQATLRGLKISSGSFTGSLPTLGTTIKVGYLLESSNLRFVAGTREADGLGSFIATTLFKKIP